MGAGSIAGRHQPTEAAQQACACVCCSARMRQVPELGTARRPTRGLQGCRLSPDQDGPHMCSEQLEPAAKQHQAPARGHGEQQKACCPVMVTRMCTAEPDLDDGEKVLCVAAQHSEHLNTASLHDAFCACAGWQDSVGPHPLLHRCWEHLSVGLYGMEICGGGQASAGM